MSKHTLSSAQVVHWTLYACIIALLFGTGYAVTLTHQKLASFVTEVDHLKIDSEVNQRSIENAQKLRRALDDNKDSVTRAAAIVADTKYYEYQDQIVQDIASYANAAGLTVLGFDFTPSTQSHTSTVKGLKTVVATISLKSPVPYPNYLRFLKLIERNLTKMQVTELEIANDLKTPGAIDAQLVTLEVYVR